VFETNYWGTVHRCRIALEHLRRRGGALINIGSVLSERAFPLQGAPTRPPSTRSRVSPTRSGWS
jgi:NAD(P)-dependent dehydrogenase (short-subunit alcohol dehydrogenase family)